MVKLTAKQIQAIERYIGDLRSRLEAEFNSPEWQKDRRERAAWVRQILSKERCSTSL